MKKIDFGQILFITMALHLSLSEYHGRMGKLKLSKIILNLAAYNNPGTNIPTIESRRLFGALTCSTYILFFSKLFIAILFMEKHEHL